MSAPGPTALPATLWPPPLTETGQVVLPGKCDRPADVFGICGTDDHRRIAIDHRVEDAASVIEPGVAGSAKGSLERSFKGSEGCWIEGR